MGAGTAHGRVCFCPLVYFFLRKFNVLNVFPVKFCTDTDLKGRSEKALAYVAVVLIDAKDKCNSRWRFRSLGLSLPNSIQYFTVKILPKTSTLKSQLFCYVYGIMYTLYLPFFLPFMFLPSISSPLSCSL